MSARALWLVALAAVAGPCCQCGCEEQPATADGSVDSSETGVDAADARLDAGVDGSPDAWPERDACDATFIELPPSGDTYVAQVANMGRYVVYDDFRQPSSTLWCDVYLYDLATCTEYPITNKEWAQAMPFVWGNRVVYSEGSDFSSSLLEMNVFNINTNALTPLTSGEIASWPYFNDQVVVYNSRLDVPPEQGDNLVLWDLQTDEKIVLAEYWRGVEDVSISETHASWVAYGGPDKDVFYVDLVSRQVSHVESTYDPYTAFTATWGDWVLWEDNRHGTLEVMGLRISTGEEVRLTDNGANNGRPTLRNGVACFRTTLWGDADGWDLVVHDLETDAMRRVTTTSDWGYKCGFVDSGWLVYRLQTGSSYHKNKIFAVNLAELGILDGAGHVVPE